VSDDILPAAEPLQVNPQRRTPTELFTDLTTREAAICGVCVTD
jgi:hypothetical protein